MLSQFKHAGTFGGFRTALTQILSRVGIMNRSWSIAPHADPCSALQSTVHDDGAEGELKRPDAKVPREHGAEPARYRRFERSIVARLNSVCDCPLLGKSIRMTMAGAALTLFQSRNIRTAYLAKRDSLRRKFWTLPIKILVSPPPRSSE